MNQAEQFVIDKVKYGFVNKKPPEPFSQTDFQRLTAIPGDDGRYVDIPKQEWNEWSMKIHSALQVAFMIDTESYKNREKINEWRQAFTSLIKDAELTGKKLSVIDTLALHFFQYDLLHYVIEVFGKKSFNETETKLYRVFSGSGTYNQEARKGCMASVIIFAVSFYSFAALIFIILHK